MTVKDSSSKKTVVIPFAHYDLALLTVDHCTKHNIADFILIGDTTKMKELSRELSTSLEGVELIDEKDEMTACSLAAKLIHQKRAQVLLKGLSQTSTFTKAILDKNNNLLEGNLISHVAVFEIPNYHKPLILTDCALNVEPTLEQKVQILQNALKVARGLGVTQPKVACVSFVEKVNPKFQATVDAEKLSQMKDVFGDAIIEGPMAFDVAVSKEAAVTKGIESRIAGEVDIILFPELNSANCTYKCLTTLCNAKVKGLVGGLNVPVVLTSRADSEEVKLASLELALSLTK